MTDDTRFTRRRMLEVSTTAGAAAALTTLAPSDLLAAPDGPKVPTKVLGKTGKKIPILLFGGAVDLDQKFDPKLAEALRYGVSYFDTADCYGGGTSETAIGNFLEKTKTRERVWITSKSDAHDVVGLNATLKQSLSKLKTSFIDMYYLHALDDASFLTPELEKTVDGLKKSGTIRHFGFSCHDGNVVELLNKAATLPFIDSIMFRYNFRKYGDVELNKAMDACAKANIGLIAMKTQGSEASFQDAWRKFQGSGQWTKHQAVLKAVWADPRITAAVSHMDTFEKLRQNVAAAVDNQKLGALDEEALERYAAATRGFACDGCDHICGKHVDGEVRISATMRYLMYHDVYGESEKAVRLFRELPVVAQNLDRDFRGARTACPHGVDVVAHMKRAQDIFTV